MTLKTARSATVAAGAVLDPAKTKNVSNKLVTRMRNAPDVYQWQFKSQSSD
jgi:hypothetical protein